MDGPVIYHYQHCMILLYELCCPNFCRLLMIHILNAFTPVNTNEGIFKLLFRFNSNLFVSYVFPSLLCAHVSSWLWVAFMGSRFFHKRRYQHSLSTKAWLRQCVCIWPCLRKHKPSAFYGYVTYKNISPIFRVSALLCEDISCLNNF